MSDIKPTETPAPREKLEAQIKSADMTEDMQQESIEVAQEAMAKFTIEKDIAQHIKRTFDERKGPTWHCIVGRNFGSFVTHGAWLKPCRDAFLLYPWARSSHDIPGTWLTHTRLCRDQALHLLLPWPLRNSTIQNAIGMGEMAHRWGPLEELVVSERDGVVGQGEERQRGIAFTAFHAMPCRPPNPICLCTRRTAVELACSRLY
ncbi:Dynein light chain [Fusarium solani]